jgi:hypothetical protein
MINFRDFTSDIGPRTLFRGNFRATSPPAIRIKRLIPEIA